jgi:pilus assembly protein CpaB
MSSTLRLSIIMVLLLATTALGLIAYSMNRPQENVPVVQVTEKATAPLPVVRYLVAARELPRGTLAREEDFAVHSAPSDGVPTGAILETPDAKAGLNGSLVRKLLNKDSPVTLQDLLRPRDQGFLANVLAPNNRAISIKVDAESGVSGLIRPGDYVDVVLTQVVEKTDVARRAVSETILRNIRIIAIDQEMEQGGPTINATAGKVAQTVAQTVSLQLAPEQVKKITVAKYLGTLSLAMRAAVGDTADIGTISSCDVSPEIARQDAIAGARAAVVIHAGGKATEYSVKKHDSGDTGCGVSPEISRRSAMAVVHAGDKLSEKQ